MGPFTESLVYAFNNSSGEIQELFALAARKTTEISPGQEPVMHMSRKVDRIQMRPQGRKQQDNRAVELLNASEALYRDKVWDQFLATFERAQVLALDPAMQQRCSREVDWVRLVMSAEDSEKKHNWDEAAVSWEKASIIFPARQWAAMRAAVAWLMADRLDDALGTLSRVAQAEGQFAPQANQILSELSKTYPELALKASNTAQKTSKVSGKEFELLEAKE
jgi:hypothetical protein